ncbi:MAG: ATP-binding protein [Campylobacterales bacterium]|nr:ATP-binding protein [Campylobacterales bacterium]
MANEKSIKGLNMSQEHLNLTEPIRKKIIIRTAIGIVLVAFFTLLVLVIPLYLQLVDANKRDFAFKHKAKVELFDKSITNFKNITEQITSRTKIREKLVEYNEGKVTLAQLQDFSRGLLADAMQTSKEIVAINRLDSKRNSVLNLGLSVPQKLADSLSVPMKGAKIFEPFRIQNTIVVAVACPILDKKKEVGVDIVLFDSKSIQKVLNNYEGFGKTGDTILGKKIGSNIEGFFVSRNGEKRRSLEALEKENIVVSNLSTAPWTALSRTDTSELNELLNKNIIFLVIVVIALVVLGLIGIVKLTDPLLGMLENNLKQLKEHKENLEEIVKVRTAELIVAKEQAESANKAKSIFLANMSHELRTPLNAVLGFSRLMKNDTDITEDQRKNLEIINSSGEYLLSLINNVLDISKIESGHMVAEESVFDLYVLLHEVQSLMNVRAYEKGLAFSLKQSLDLPRFISSDGGKIRQIIINLVGNAIKFTSNGEVFIDVKVAKQDSPKSAHLRFEIKDSGVGISKGDAARIFLPFEQADISVTKEAGTGLGLAICKQYVELLGGTIGVNSQIGEGSTFYFELPVKVANEPLQFEENRVGGNVVGLADQHPSYRLLIAEDQAANRLLLHKLLEPLGFELREAVNGEEAVRMNGEWKPHLIFMDMRMPIMNGLDASRHIRASQNGNDVKIVAITAHALEEERLEMLNAGCDDLIRKPYRESEIFDALHKYLGVEFVYADKISSHNPSESMEDYETNLSKLSTAVQKELLSSLELLDEKASFAVIDKISDTDTVLAETLRKMVKKMQYKKLLMLLEKSIENTAI